MAEVHARFGVRFAKLENEFKCLSGMLEPDTVQLASLVFSHGSLFLIWYFDIGDTRVFTVCLDDVSLI